ncbi:MAG: hypothetical protein QG633_242 [Patescibacteria group bacterium]|jgi:hypothetical protein|nr:hypothetical protein [Patescibacteria group bacterium]
MKTPEGFPFKENPKKIEAGHGRLFNLPSAPDKIIRNIDPRVYENGKVIQSNKTSALKTISLFNELKKYIPTPAEMVIAKLSDKPESLYMVTDKIEGQELSDILYSEVPLPSEMREALSVELNSLYLSWLEYVKSKSETGGSYFSDIFKNRQYVFGTRRTEKEPHLYLVDTDPYFEDARPEEPDRYKGLYLRLCLEIKFEIEDAKDILGPTRFEEVNTKLAELKKLFEKETA